MFTKKKRNLEKRAEAALVWSIGVTANTPSAPQYCIQLVVVCGLSGILCGTISGKKKKKMMYLTAKNAGEEDSFILTI